MSQREYKEHYVVNDSLERIQAALARAATSNVLELSVTTARYGRRSTWYSR